MSSVIGALSNPKRTYDKVVNDLTVLKSIWLKPLAPADADHASRLDHFYRGTLSSILSCTLPLLGNITSILDHSAHLHILHLNTHILNTTHKLFAQIKPMRVRSPPHPPCIFHKTKHILS